MAIHSVQKNHWIKMPQNPALLCIFPISFHTTPVRGGCHDLHLTNKNNDVSRELKIFQMSQKYPDGKMAEEYRFKDFPNIISPQWQSI